MSDLLFGGMGMPRTGFDWHTHSTLTGSEALAATAPFLTYCIEHLVLFQSLQHTRHPCAESTYYPENWHAEPRRFHYNGLHTLQQTTHRRDSP